MEQVIYTSRKFTVVRHPVRTRGGGSVEVDFVRHPGAVVILPVLSDDELVMIRNFRHAIDRELWELPAGTLDAAGEAPELAAHRELEEETGYQAGRMTKLCEFYPSPGMLSERMLVFVAEHLTKSAPKLEETEQITTHTMKAGDAIAMALDGRIEDAKTIVSLLRWDHLRRMGR